MRRIRYSVAMSLDGYLGAADVAGKRYCSEVDAAYLLVE